MRFRTLKTKSGVPVFMAYVPELMWQDENLLNDIGIDTTNPWHAEEWYALKERFNQEVLIRDEGRWFDIPNTIH